MKTIAGKGLVRGGRTVEGFSNVPRFLKIPVWWALSVSVWILQAVFLTIAEPLAILFHLLKWFSSNYIVPVHNSSHCTVSLHRILYCIQATLQPCNSFVVFDMLELFCAEIWWRWRAWRKQAFTAVIIKLCSETQRQNTHVQPAHVHKSFS